MPPFSYEREQGSIWERFDEEFVRVQKLLSVTELELAERIGVSWRKINSSGRRTPKWLTPVILGHIGVIGFDINYILSNKRSPCYKPDEVALLDNYRNTTPERKASLREVGSAFAEPKIAIDADGTYEDVGQRKKW